MQDENQNILEELETELLKKKLSFMVSWTTLFFHEEHRAVMAYLCHQKLGRVEKVSSKEDHLFWKCKNIETILGQLKEGFMVTF